LTTDTDNDTAVIGVAHEAFLSVWPPLAQAIAENVSALRARRSIEHAAAEWKGNGHPPSRLWGGGQLAAAVADTGARIRAAAADASAERGPARRLRRRAELVADRVELSPTARDFLHTSIRRDRYLRRRVTTVLSVLLILALAAAGIAVIQQRAAQDQQQIATARQLVAQADAIRDTDPRTALQLGIAAQRIHSGGETQSSLVTTLTTTRYAGTLTGHGGPVSTVAFAPDGPGMVHSPRGSLLWHHSGRLTDQDPRGLPGQENLLLGPLFDDRLPVPDRWPARRRYPTRARHHADLRW